EGAAGREFGSTRLLLIPETAAGLHALHELCGASPRVFATMTPVSGPVAGDVARAVGYRPSLEGGEQQHIWGKVILDTRAAGDIVPIAGILGFDVSDTDAAAMLIRRARGYG